jgi:hypothetical protein
MAEEMIILCQQMLLPCNVGVVVSVSVPLPLMFGCFMLELTFVEVCGFYFLGSRGVNFIVSWLSRHRIFWIDKLSIKPGNAFDLKKVVQIYVVCE